MVYLLVFLGSWWLARAHLRGVHVEPPEGSEAEDVEDVDADERVAPDRLRSGSVTPGVPWRIPSDRRGVVPGPGSILELAGKFRLLRVHREPEDLRRYARRRTD